MTGITMSYLREVMHQAIATPTGLTVAEFSGAMIVLLIVGLYLVFGGNDSRTFVFTFAGLVYGAFLAYNLAGLLNLNSIPVYLVVAAGALTGALVLTFALVAGLSAGFGVLAYLGTSEFVSGPYYLPAAAGIIAFLIALALYRNHVHVVAVFIGSFTAYYAMLRIGISVHNASVVTLFIFVMGIIIQELDKNRREKKRIEETTHWHRAPSSTRVTSGKQGFPCAFTERMKQEPGKNHFLLLESE